MWTPPERIKHSLPEARWPSAAEAAGSRWFSPVRIGPLRARTRTWVPAMVPWRATAEGEVTEDVIAWYRRFALGRPGVLVVEATGIRDVPSGPLLRVGHDRFVPGLARLVEAVRQASEGETLLFIQLIDFLSIRRRPPRDRFFGRFLQITERHRAALARRTGEPRWSEVSETSEAQVREALAGLEEEGLAEVLDDRERDALERGERERVTDLHLPHIAALPRVLPGLFTSAAERAVAAGFDGIELHYAHAYTMASFLSGRNDRGDRYGGSREARVRLPREVLEAVRARVDGARAVGLRFLGEEKIPGGSTVKDACYYGVELARAGADFLSVSTGGKFDDAAQPKVGEAAYPYTGPSGYECMPTRISDSRGPFGRNVAAAAAIKRAVNQAGLDAPVVTAGGIMSFDQAEGILARGEADVVASARQTLADPDWFAKIRSGAGAEIRRCDFTNYCEALDQRHLQVTCKRWDRLELDEPDLRLDPSGRRRLVAPPWRR